MNHIAYIRKIGLLILRDAKLLVVRKKGGTLWILPGGKPTGDETDEEALRREIFEELGCHVSWAKPYCECTTAAADLPGKTVTVVGFLGEIIGVPRACEEIEEIRWIDIASPDVPLAISIAQEILPVLISDFSD